MRPTDTLKAEHRLIEKVLEVVERSVQNDDYNVSVFEGALPFFRQFADRRHHGKEEDRLFPAMHLRGLPKDSGPVACMVEEHNYGRDLLKKVDASLAKAHGGDAEARRKVIGNYRAYCAFLREHIYKEDNILFPMADEVLTKEDQAKLEADFTAFDEGEIGEEDLKKYPQLAEELVGAGSKA